MEQRNFLVVFQDDGSLEINDIDESMPPMDVSSSIFTYHIHSKKALVAVAVIGNGMFDSFPSGAQMKQIRNAVIAKVQFDEL